MTDDLLGRVHSADHRVLGMKVLDRFDVLIMAITGNLKDESNGNFFALNFSRRELTDRYVNGWYGDFVKILDEHQSKLFGKRWILSIDIFPLLIEFARGNVPVGGFDVRIVQFSHLIDEMRLDFDTSFQQVLSST